MPTLKQLAVESLSHMVESGQRRLAVDDDARAILREWMLASRGGAKAEVPPAAAVEMSVEQKLDLLRSRAVDWKAARRLGTLRETMVFAVGNPHARLMLVGEAPGYEEERQGEPFVGPAGQLLDKMILAMQFKREDVYIANIVKCRPPRNRAPMPEEAAACIGYLEHQIRMIKPEVIVLLGATAAHFLLKREEGIMRLRGRWLEYDGIPVMPTFHPAFLLRQESAKRDSWEDLKLVMRKLGKEPPAPRRAAQ